MKTHNWKRLFYLLLGLNIVIVACLFIFFIFLTSGNQETSEVPNTDTEQKDVTFQITTNKEELNQLIQYYLEKKQGGTFSYQVMLTDEVEFVGRIPVLQEEVEVKLTFVPVVLENGDVELQQKDMRIGKFRLPSSIVLQFIQNSDTLPEWIIVKPNDGRVYLALQQLKLKSDYTIAAKEINLKEDKIIFTLGVPIQ